MALLEVNRLHKSFGGIRAVNDLTFSIEQGEILGLIGPNGAGKTTVFEVISGFTSPDSGGVKLNGHDIVGLKPYSLCERGICRTFQLAKPFLNLTVLENVMIGILAKGEPVKTAKEKGNEILKFLNLLDFKDIQAKFLTIGYKRRLELAKALSTQPKLVLADEVMSGLNEKEVMDTMDILKKINGRGITLFVVEHILHAIMALAERVIVINHGAKIAEGTPAEISRNERVITAYLGRGFSDRFQDLSKEKR
ncbi:MAG: ABC transporter ATP-binding protein [Deltaproteobacteria bacterium]|nr:ABC transporter ATP-binding protein [Deltaproteobacteria bacterium]MBW2044751.1 ABC transporter ATP-binding protein [Deltaproteobacteria bacterium]MBW2301714.1 ABC transporter ATP-binding protein [Deltaproteobacteria bacterium]